MHFSCSTSSCHARLKQTSRGKRGFTLVELMVTIGIFVFMTALILARYDTFGTGTILTNMAYDIALTIRQAQTYGLSVKATETHNFNAAYGVRFDMSNNTRFILFTDSNNPPNGIYDGSAEDITAYNLKRGAHISDICVSDGSSCSTGNHLTSTIVDISFRRPDPKAIICTAAGLCAWTYAKITIASADDSSSREIFVTKVGQISL